MTNETGAAAGWYADPTGRYEHRYYNGRTWTADVSSGGERFVDQLGLAPTTATNPAGPTGSTSGIGAAAMVLGIIAITISWMPFLVVLGVIAAVLAIVFGSIGLRRSARTGSSRSSAVVGLATGASALVAAVIGVLLSVAVLDAYDSYVHPQPHETAVSDCTQSGSRATMKGTLTNTGGRTADYSVLVGFVRPGTDNAHRSTRITLDQIEPGATTAFEAQAQVDLDEVDCVILEVNGPLPFGVAVD